MSKRWFSFPVLVLPVVIAIAPGATAGENLAPNPGFEQEAEGNRPAGWRPWGETKGMELRVVQQEPHSGTRCLRIADRFSAGNSYCTSTPIPVRPGTLYRLACWVRADRPHTVQLCLQLLGSTDADFRGWEKVTVVATRRWQQMEMVTGCWPASVRRVLISLVPVEMDRKSTGTAWFDDVYFGQASEADRAAFLKRTAQELDEAAKPYQVACAPAEGSLCRQTPPTFVWRPHPAATRYVVQVSPSPDFPARTTRQFESHLSVFTPGEPLPAGRWYWRYGFKPCGTERYAFSRVRSFRIAADATAVPFPDVGQVVERLAQRPHPRVGLAEGELERFRQLAAGPWKTLAEQAVRRAERSVGKPLLPEPPMLPPPGDPARGPEYVRIFRQTRPFIREMDQCAFAYLATGNERLGEEARRRLMHIVGWDPNGSTSLSNHDEPGSEIVRIAPRVYDRIYPLLSDAERAKCRKVFRIRMEQLYRALTSRPFEVNPYSSHHMGYYLPDLTEACIAMAGELEVRPWLAYCLQMLWAPFYPPYGGEEGGWAEGPSYWSWTASVTLRIFVVVQRATGSPLAERPWLRQTGYFKLYCNPPYSRMSPFGDGQSGPARGAGAMYCLGAYFGNADFLWYAAQQHYQPSLRDWFLYGKPSLEPEVSLRLPQARCFGDVGLACIHTRLSDAKANIHFMLRSSPFGSISHAYADQNGFILHAYGEPLAIASGYYPYYGSPHHKSWSWQTQAANCITVDGRGQVARSWNAKGRIVCFQDTPQACYTVGDATAAYGGRLEQFLRHALFLRPGSTSAPAAVVLLDELRAAKPATFQWWLHALEEMQIDGHEQLVGIHRGGTALQVRFLEPSGLRFSQTDRFSVAPEQGEPAQWHLTASTDTPRRDCRFLTVLLPYRTSESVKLPVVTRVEGRRCAGVSLQTDNGRTVVLFRTGGGNEQSPMQWNHLATTGRVAVIVEKRGTLGKMIVFPNNEPVRE